MFDPKLQANFTFNQPTGGGPSLIGTIGGLVGDFLSVEASLGKERTPPKLTEDEKFAQDFSVFVEGKGAAFELDTKSVREFAWKYPQHSDKIFKHAENLGVLIKPPEETAIEKGIERYASEEGFLMVVAEAQNLPEEDREAHIMGYMMEREQQAAEIKKIERDKSRLEAEGSLSTKKWEAIGNVQKRQADTVISTVLEPIMTDISNGLTVEVTPEMKAQFGLRYDTIDMTNIGAVLRDMRRVLEVRNEQAYFDAFGEAAYGLPPKEWEDRVLGGVDALIDIVDQFDTPQDRLNALNALIETEAVKRLDKQGLSTATWMLKNLPPEVTMGMLTDADVMSRFQSMFTLDSNGEVDVTAIPDNAAAMSKSDATKAAADLMTSITQGGGNFEMFTAFAETAKRSGYGIVDGPTFTQMIGKSSEWMKKKASEDPDAKMYMQEWFASDINQTVTAIKTRLGPGVELIYQNGRYTVIPTPDGVGVDQVGTIDIVKDSQRALPDGLKLEDLNKKLAALKTLGPMGQEVIDVVVGATFSPQAAPTAPAGDTITKSERGAVSYDYSTSNGKIAQSLGIDFGAYEAEYGLPAGFLERTAFLESRGRIDAVSSTGATGLFQFTRGTARDYGLTDRGDPIASTDATVRLAADNAKGLRRALGREPTGAELYLAHQQGLGGAKALLAGGSMNVVDALLPVYEGNRARAEQAVNVNGGNVRMTAMEFASLWLNKFNGQKPTSGPAGSPVTPMVGPGDSAPPTISLPNSDVERSGPIVGATAVETAQGSRGSVMSTLASPEVEKMIVESQDSEALKQRAMEILTRKTIDKDVAELIKAFIGEK